MKTQCDRRSSRGPEAGISGTTPTRRGLQGGFTIIEIMIVVTLIAILITVAAPSFRTMIISNQLRSVSGDFLNALAVARSEATKQSQRVVLCPSNDQATCTSATAWSDGWIAFVDSAVPLGQRNPGTETLLKVQQAAPSSVTMSSSGVPDVRFKSIGFVETARSFTICPTTTGTGVAGRTITINTLGRVQSTTTTCP